ncbi:MAG: pirin [Frankiales bacterium]|nr:pirin [Frankiales bacterium]
MQVLRARAFDLGEGTQVRRLIPQRALRTVGAWCFADHYGPDDVALAAGMQVPPHPHTGLQTVSWLLEGEILHRDSLGSLQRVGPRELSLMTSGDGISHSEESPAGHPPVLHGVQLWVALPEGRRGGPAAYEHHSSLPEVSHGDLTATVVLGTHAGVSSPGSTHSPLVGLEVAGEGVLPLEPSWEHVAFALSGTASVDGSSSEVGELVQLGVGRTELDVAGHVMVLGGEPLTEQLVLWWNFVCRSNEEVVQARADWEGSTGRFGTVEGYPGPALAAPPLGPVRLMPRS